MKSITENKTIDRKPFRKLGFTYLETAEIVVSLNQLMANYFVHYNKLRNFHWNVDGHDFFELHEEFEKEYNTVNQNIDIIAERIRVFGLKPSMKIKEILDLSLTPDVVVSFFINNLLYIEIITWHSIRQISWESRFR